MVVVGGGGKFQNIKIHFEARLKNVDSFEIKCVIVDGGVNPNIGC